MMFYQTVRNVGASQADPTPSPVLTWLWHLVTDNWVRLVGCVLTVAAAGAAWRVWRRWLWRRAVARGSWVEVVAPRETAVTATAAVWRLLSSVAARAGSGVHLVHPPLAVEFHGDGRGQVSLNLWVPKWVPVALVSTEAQRAWPGAQVRPFVPPMGGPAWKAAGFTMAVHDTDHEMLVDDVYLRSRLAAAVSGNGDPLRPVFDALRAADGPTVLQALAKPAGSKQFNRLARAARQPTKRRKPWGLKALDLVLAAVTGVFRLLLDLITAGSNHRGSGRGYQPTAPSAPDPLQRLAMRRAADKLKAGPHLMVAIRAVALRPERGWAASEASLLANGYRVAARGLRPKRLWWAKSAVSDRHAARREWFLVTASEMGVLFHLPADPALFGFNVAAAQRPFPHQATKLRPEQTSDTEPGWSRGKWTGPSGTPKTALAMRDHHGEDSDGTTEAEFFDPWGMPLSGDPNPHSENNQFIDDDLDSDWDYPYDNQKPTL